MRRKDTAGVANGVLRSVLEGRGGWGGRKDVLCNLMFAAFSVSFGCYRYAPHVALVKYSSLQHG